MLELCSISVDFFYRFLAKNNSRRMEIDFAISIYFFSLSLLIDTNESFRIYAWCWCELCVCYWCWSNLLLILTRAGSRKRCAKCSLMCNWIFFIFLSRTWCIHVEAFYFCSSSIIGMPRGAGNTSPLTAQQPQLNFDRKHRKAYFRFVWSQNLTHDDCGFTKAIYFTLYNNGRWNKNLQH